MSLRIITDQVIRYRADDSTNGINEKSPQCTICLDEYEENQKVRILKCSHHFHAKCSDQWLFLKNKCPLCQQNIVDAEDVHLHHKRNGGAEVEMVELQQLQREDPAPFIIGFGESSDELDSHFDGI